MAGAESIGAPSPERRAPSDRVFVRDGERCWFYRREIVLFEAEGNYTRVHFGAHRRSIRTSLKALNAASTRRVLPREPEHIVNLRFIEEMAPAVEDR